MFGGGPFVKRPLPFGIKFGRPLIEDVNVLEVEEGKETWEWRISDGREVPILMSAVVWSLYFIYV